MNLRRLFYRKRILKKLLFYSFIFLSTLFICEFLVFYIYIAKCNWNLDRQDNLNEFNLRIISLSDVHLFGLKRGYFLDKLKREWQMFISFKISLFLFNPNLVLFLGDIFDEGLIANENEFNLYVKRFKELFKVDENVKLIVATGNHDVGFHDRMLYFEPLLRERFENVFNSSLIEWRKIFGVNIININSMALDGDGCFLCENAKIAIERIRKKLFDNCNLNLKKNKILCVKEKPIIISHFPLYRENDLDCSDPGFYDEKKKSHILIGKDCLNKIATNNLLEKLQPKLVINGHTHYGCIKTHTVKVTFNYTINVVEYTLSSFNWRFSSNPFFLLILATESKFRVSRCILPNENYLFMIYIFVFFYIVHNFFKPVFT